MSSSARKDFVEMALTRERDQFIAQCAFPFLLGRPALVRPAGSRTLATDGGETAVRDTPQTTGASTSPVLLAIRKVQASFPNMITIGRTANHDIVIEDVQVSKFHAFFRVGNGKMELFDAGSRNGTWVGDRKLEPKGAGLVVQGGDVIRLSQLEFTVLDAGRAWDRLRRRMTPR
jgi:pSer/pThr/pTyr-binding forkhead associated (FHA) protein